MDYIDEYSINKTIQSYKKALGEILEICPNLRMCAVTSNNREFLPTGFNDCCDGHKFKFKANNIFVNFDHLFVLDRARNITTDSSVYQSSFFRVILYFVKNFDLYGWNYRHSDSKGNIIKEKELITWIPQNLKINLLDKSWGLKQWKDEYNEIRDFCNACPSEIKEKYLKCFNNADEEIEKWKIEIEKANKLTINL